MSSMNEFQHLRISLEDIKSATKNFTDCIGQGGFGKVYKGELLISDVLTMVAVKQLDNSVGQGGPEFWREIMLLNRYKHENLVSLLGFCDEGSEKILVYEYLPNKSLDLYLSSTDLSWNQRLRVCIGAAHGLQYLHEPFEGSQQRVLHRDIKSGNILLDENWKAKIADFGLSKFGPANQEHTFLYSTAVGTMGYCDPLYVQTGYLTKESDVYSFGAVLFEVLCGRPCVQNYEDIRRFLPVLARRCYEEKKLDIVIHDSLKGQISPMCLERFSKTAYQCLRIDRIERPLVTEIVKELEIALQYQEEYEFEKENELKRTVVSESDSDEYWETKLPRDLEEIIKTFEIPNAVCFIKKELFSFLHKGVLFDGDKKFFWINNDGKKCLAVSSESFLDVKRHKHLDLESQRDSRFPKVAEYSFWRFEDVECEIKTSMLSLGTMYEARLVFKYPEQPHLNIETDKLITIKWKTKDLDVRSTHNAELTSSDNWFSVKMWHFINRGLNADFDITIERLSFTENPSISSNGLLIQGIEFHPIEMHEDTEGTDCHAISDDEYWEKQLPSDYRIYIELSDKPLKYTTKKELYFLLCAGFLGDNGQVWFSLCERYRRICFTLPAKDILYNCWGEELETLHLSESRFGEALRLPKSYSYGFGCRIRPFMFSRYSKYACYLVCKREDYQHGDIWLTGNYYLNGTHEGPLLTPTVFSSDSEWVFPMNIPLISPKDGFHDLSNTPKTTRVDGSMEQRQDGLKKFMLCKPRLRDCKLIDLNLTIPSFSGITVEGIEFRPYI